MFISKAEKAKVFEEIEVMKVSNSNLLSNYVKQTKLINTLTVHIHNLEVRIAEMEGIKAQPKRNAHKEMWTPEMRKRQSERVKKMWAKKRQEKLPSNTVVGVPV
jgi:hypothetical protein